MARASTVCFDCGAISRKHRQDLGDIMKAVGESALSCQSSLCCLQVSPGEHYEDMGSSCKRPTGRVVGVIRRKWRARGYAGSLKVPREGQSYRRGAAVLFCPAEKKHPFIRITTRQASCLAVLKRTRQILGAMWGSRAGSAQAPEQELDFLVPVHVERDRRLRQPEEVAASQHAPHQRIE